MDALIAEKAFSIRAVSSVFSSQQLGVLANSIKSSRRSRSEFSEADEPASSDEKAIASLASSDSRTMPSSRDAEMVRSSMSVSIQSSASSGSIVRREASSR